MYHKLGPLNVFPLYIVLVEEYAFGLSTFMKEEEEEDLHYPRGGRTE